jgi:pyrimidine/purine-5'-nucleotide nucleosidase
VHELAANLRRAFSGIVTGNVKEYGIAAIERLARTSCRATRRS